MDDLRWLDATAQAELVRRGEVRADELVDAASARIEALDPRLNAVVTPIEPRPAQAAAPFTGVPMLVKDLALDVRDTRATQGSRWLADHRSPHDAELTRRYRRAGLVIIGKTNTCELGLSPTVEPALFGPARNPWDLQRSTGGSSGGSAAAVAAGLVPLAHGNDLGGSIRYPAAWCGVVGLKPTRGRVPVTAEYGEVVARCWADHVLTRTVRDSAAVLDAVDGRPTGGAGRVGERLRIGVSTRPRGGQHVDAAWCNAAEHAADLLEQLGHRVEEGSPDGLDDPAYGPSLEALYTGAGRRLFTAWCRTVGRSPEGSEIEPQTRALWERALRVSATEEITAAEALERITQRVSAWFATYDAWLTPTLGAGPPPLGELVGTEHDPLAGLRNAGRYLMFDAELANVTGNPAMSLPFGFDDSGLPVAIHITGRFGDDATLLRLASELEEARPWAQHTPAS